MTLHTAPYRALATKLIEIRKAAGLSQRSLAAKLGRPNSMISLIETGARRVDIVELADIAIACGREPEEVAVEVMRQLRRSVPGTRRRR